MMRMGLYRVLDESFARPKPGSPRTAEFLRSENSALPSSSREPLYWIRFCVARSFLTGRVTPESR
jgi:hypothetical protein